MRYFDDTKNWVHYITRPFTLFEATLWNLWYHSEQTRTLFGVDMPDVLLVEERLGVVRQYRIREQLAKFKKSIKEIVMNDPRRYFDIMAQADVLNRRASEYLKDPQSAFFDLRLAVDFFTGLCIYSTVFPYLAYIVVEDFKIDNKLLIERLDILRAVSLYPIFLSKVILPLAKAELRKYDVLDSDAVGLLTVSEVLDGKITEIDSRLKKRGRNQVFVYQKLDGKEMVKWVDENEQLIAQIEGVIEETKFSERKQLRGRPTLLGKVRGVARIILTNDWADYNFDDGDILVSINSSPVLMPLLKKCGAIVTEEGGLTCHAAIISRELNKPCLVGVKKATSVIKDGAFIEVDANEGVLTII